MLLQLRQDIRIGAVREGVDFVGDSNEQGLNDGNPVGMSTTVNGDGSVTDNGGSNPTTGYGLFEASDLDDAIAKAKSCPILSSGGTVELAEAIDM